MDLFEIEASKYIRNFTYSAKEAIEQFQQVLLNSTNTKSFKFAQCKAKFQYDIAMVEVIMDSPTVIKYIQAHRVTVTDKLANFGKLITLTKQYITNLYIYNCELIKRFENNI